MSMKIKDIQGAPHTQAPFIIKAGDEAAYKIPQIDFISLNPLKF